jgi:hypothetical protein
VIRVPEPGGATAINARAPSVTGAPSAAASARSTQPELTEAVRGVGGVQVRCGVYPCPSRCSSKAQRRATVGWVASMFKNVSGCAKDAIWVPREARPSRDCYDWVKPAVNFLSATHFAAAALAGINTVGVRDRTIHARRPADERLAAPNRLRRVPMLDRGPVREWAALRDL